MRFNIRKSPLIDKYYIWDSEQKKFTTETGFDFIVDIVSDKYVIVGNSYCYNVDYRYYKTYKYQLLDVKGRPVFDEEFDFVYPTDEVVYCKLSNMPINKRSYLGNYIWNHKHGQSLSKDPFYYCGDETAIIRCEYWQERNDFGFSRGYVYKMIDFNGHIIREEKVNEKESVIKVFGDAHKNKFSDLVYIDIMDVSVDKKWERINELAERTDKNYFNLCDFKLSEKYYFHNVKISFAWEEFLILIKMEDNPHYTGYDFQPKYLEGKCIAILNDSFEVIYYSKDGFNINPKTFHDRIIIDQEYIIESDGKLYNMPKDVVLDNFHTDWEGYVIVKKDNKTGYVNNKGELVIPTIFPKDIQTGIDEDAANESWREYQSIVADFVSDAYEGDSDARWNTD